MMTTTETEEKRTPPIDIEAIGWAAQEPPPKFAETVADAFIRERNGPSVPTECPPARPHRRRWLAGFVALATSLLVWIAWPRPGLPTAGRLQTGELQTVTIRDGVLAVARPGTEMRWEADPDGSIRVEQDAGRVFYRVNDAKRFEVTTPAGTVLVTGTCFEVDMRRSETMKGRDVASATLGATLAGAMVVTVYEGRVVLANDQGDVVLEAGQRAIADEHRAPRRWDDDVADPSIDPSGALQRQARELERLRTENDAQHRELEALREQVEALGGTTEDPDAARAHAKKCANYNRGGGPDAECSFFDPDPDTLVEMAKCATVKVDEPGFFGEVELPDVAPYVTALGITDSREAAAFQAAAERLHTTVNHELRAIHAELGGDPEVGRSASPQLLTAFIKDQFDDALIYEIQRRVADERAGLAEPPPEGKEASLEERFWRLQVEMGNDFERQLARELGPVRARELRAVHDGWPGRSSVYGGQCQE